MGGPGSGRWPRGVPKGTPRYAANRAPRQQPVPEGSAVGSPQPTGNAAWHPVAKAWWKALGMSDTARVFQQVDWVFAWTCNDVLDNMYKFGFSPGMIKEWHAM